MECFLQAGMKFEFKNVNQFRKSGVTINQLVDEILILFSAILFKALLSRTTTQSVF